MKWTWDLPEWKCNPLYVICMQQKLGIKLALAMWTAILYSRWRYSQTLKGNNVEFNVLYDVKVIFKWKSKKQQQQQQISFSIKDSDLET